MRQRAGVNLIGTVPSASARARAVPSIQPLLAGYPTGTPTSNPDLDLAQRAASSSIDEYFGSFRLDHHINDKFSQYLRYNRDQGYLTQPLDVTGIESDRHRRSAKRGVHAAADPEPDHHQRDQAGLQRQQDARSTASRPPIPGVDTSAFAVSFTGTVAIPGVGGQGASAGAAVAGQSGPRQQFAERPRAAVHQLHDVVHRQSQRRSKKHIH